jgi:hypothetical protein
MDGPVGLGLALGHVRNAASAFLAVDDPSSECLFLAAECLDLEGLFTELGVAPEFVDEGLDAAGSLSRASALLEEIRPEVPPAVWVAVESLRTRAAR